MICTKVNLVCRFVSSKWQGASCPRLTDGHAEVVGRLIKYQDGVNATWNQCNDFP